MAYMGISLSVMKHAPSREKGIIVRVLKFAGYVHHYKNLCLLTIFGLVLKSKMATKGIAST